MADGEERPGGLGSIAVRGVAVTGLAQVMRTALQVGSVIVLARLLSPTDYGLVAMVLAVIGIAELIRDLGLSPAAIRAPTLSEGEQSNLFWINSGVGLVLSVLVAALSPLIALAYGRPELVAITLALSPSFFLSGLSTQYRVILTRRLQFGRLAGIDLTATVLALGVGVALASTGAGYWALVGQQLTGGVVILAMLVGTTKWWARRYDRSVPVAGFVRLGASFVASSLLSYLNRNADSVIVGRLFGAASLGLYSRSVQLIRTPLNQLQAPFGTVVLPVLAAARDDDERLMSAALRAQIAFSYPLLMVVASIVACAVDFVRLTLGEQWVDAAPVMSFVAVSGGLTSAGYAAVWIFAARGMARAMTQFNLLGTALTLSLLAAGSLFGVVGVAAGLAAAPLLGWPLSLLFLSRGGLPVRALAAAGARALGTALVAGALGRLSHTVASDLPLVLRVVVPTLVVLATAAALAVVPAVRRDYLAIRTMASLLRRRRTDRPGDLLTPAAGPRVG